MTSIQATAALAIRRKRRNIRKQIVVMASILTLFSHIPWKTPIPMNLCGTRGLYATKDLVHGHEGRFKDLIRMSPHTFYALVMWLTSHAGLSGSRNVSAHEKVLIFLFVTGQGITFRVAGYIMGHSVDTIHRAFHKVLNACIVLAYHKIRLPEPSTSRTIEADPKLYPYFKRVLGALDSSHFPIKIGINNQKPWRNRKGGVSTNVLVAYTLEGILTFVMPSWEGSANNIKILNNAFSQGFKIPSSWFYLADASYNCSNRLLIPYRSVRYHLQESARAGLRPANAEELYNLRHSQTRIIIKKAIGRLKGTFRIHRISPSFDVDVQVKVILATAGIINWLLQYNDFLSSYTNVVDDEVLTLNNVIRLEKGLVDRVKVPGGPGIGGGALSAGSGNDFTEAELNGGAAGYIAQYRDRIAKRMWRGYCNELAMKGEK